MRIDVLTSLYPSSVRPVEGVFAERRWSGMRRRGHDVHVVHPQPYAPLAFLGRALGRPHWGEIARMPRAELRAGVAIERPRYVHVPGRALGNARAFARAGARAVRARGAPDVAVLDYAWPAAQATERLCAAGIPVVIHGRGSDVLEVAGIPALAAELAAALRRAGRWCAVSQDLVDAMDRLAGAQRGVLVPNGVDLELFQPGDRAAARAGLGLSPSGALVLAVGHLIARKDPLLALEAFARGAPADARIAFVGAGPLERELARRIAELGLAQRAFVRRSEPPEALARWYAACDVLLLASSREGRPNVVLEALACGRPVAATRAGGTAELLAGLDGSLAATRDADALAAALRAMLASPPPPERCRSLVRALTWERSFQALEAVLESARGGGAAR